MSFTTDRIITLYNEIHSASRNLAREVANQDCASCGGSGFVTVDTLRNGVHDQYESPCECIEVSSDYYYGGDDDPQDDR